MISSFQRSTAYFFKKNFVLHKSSIYSVSVKTHVCLITQETKIQKFGHQQPVHQESVAQSLLWYSSHFHFPGPCRWTGSPFTSFTTCPNLIKTLPHCISMSPSSPYQPFFLRNKEVPWNVGNIWICVNLLWEVLAPTTLHRLPEKW